MKTVKYMLMLIFSILFIVFVYNDYFLYKTPILKINKIKENEITNKETIYEQEVTGVIKNGEYKGNVYTFYNNTCKLLFYGVCGYMYF